ncbi:hypothetical protein Tsubulata_013147, partial [Turnera subulata]
MATSLLRRREFHSASLSAYKSVQKLQRACLRNPVKECYLVYILTEMSGSTSMVFTRTCDATSFLALLLRNLGFRAILINGHMNQDYIHRVGRTARAGRSGVAISLPNQYEIEWYLQIEKLIVTGECYLVYILTEMSGSTSMVFTRTCDATSFLALLLRNLGFRAIPIFGHMNQSKRLGALNKFKAGEYNILICTDVASRGLDIPSVDMVINYDIPTNSKVGFSC